MSLPSFPDWPSPLKDLIKFDGGPVSSRFMRLIRHYNSMFCFTSLGARVDQSINVGGGPYVFKMNGVVYHRIGPLLPSGNSASKYAQLYMVDSADEVQLRISAFDRQGAEMLDPDPGIVASLIAMLNRHHKLVHKFRMARANPCSPSAPRVAIHFMGDEGGGHGDRFSGPASCEVAALIVGDYTPECKRFDVIAKTRSGFLQHVSSLNSSLIPLQYPLLFPFGDKGFHLGIKYIATGGFHGDGHCNIGGRLRGRSSRGQVSMMEYYNYYFHYRRGEPNPYTCCGRLSQQIGVNSYSCVEANRLDFHFQQQDDLRSETYQGITDAVGQGASTGENLGIQFILHSSFTGGPRYMVLNYHDSMAICREYGAPDLFVTFTCNPKWQEVGDALAYEGGQTHVDRPDIVTRVFNIKFEEFLEDVKDGSAFGAIQAYLYVVEFQKRGLPHTHTLIWLKESTKDPSPAFIDNLVCAELPDPVVDPLGYILVDEFMVHGPCGMLDDKCPCMKDGTCSKPFPKSFNSETMVDEMGFPVYRRRPSANFVLRKKGTLRLDNQWVVPYNMKLLKKF